MLVKKDNVGEFSDCDEISILGTTTLRKNNFGFLKFYVLQRFLSNGDFGNFDGPSVN